MIRPQPGRTALLLAAFLISASSLQGGSGQLPSLADVAKRNARPLAPPANIPAGEEAWIVSSVVAAIRGIVSATTGDTAERPMRVAFAPHVWAAASYGPAVAALITSPPVAEPVDYQVRTPLVALTVDALLQENVRMSAILAREMRSAAAHESAAFLVGAFALRESPGMFGDVRTALSRMAAHLAVAYAVRGTAAESLDGALARIIVSVLVGHQRTALDALDELSPRLVTDTDKAWDRALRLRITENWRAQDGIERATLIERLEQVRALRARVGFRAMGDELAPIAREPIRDWARIALSDRVAVSTGAELTNDLIARELDEAASVWSKLHGGRTAPADLTDALNERPAPSPVTLRNGQVEVQVLDWGLWAAFSQRHVSQAVTARSRYLYSLGDRGAQAQFVSDVKARFSRLTLYPVIFCWVALTEEDYQAAVALGKSLAATSPEILTAAAWNFLATKPNWVRAAAPFPLEQTWFVEAVPSGTAFDLVNRSLRPGCERPATLQQIAAWAKEMPYDSWTQWAAAWRPVAGKPSVEDVRGTLSLVLTYDLGALRRMIDYVPMNASTRITLSRQMCDIAAHQCYVLAEHLLREARDAEAAQVLERWFAEAPDALMSAERAPWLVRYYVRHGHLAQAEALARATAEVFSFGGLKVYGDFLDSQGRHDEAAKVYDAARVRYDDPRLVGTFRVREGLRTANRKVELDGWTLLQSVFPRGGERLVVNALPATPADGVVFATFGERAARAGLEAGDIIVGVDGWRVRNHQQYGVIADLRHEDAMTFTVWRGGRYQQVRATVPERLLGVGMDDYRGDARSSR